MTKSKKPNRRPARRPDQQSSETPDGAALGSHGTANQVRLHPSELADAVRVVLDAYFADELNDYLGREPDEQTGHVFCELAILARHIAPQFLLDLQNDPDMQQLIQDGTTKSEGRN